MAIPARHAVGGYLPCGSEEIQRDGKDLVMDKETQKSNYLCVLIPRGSIPFPGAHDPISKETLI